MTEVVERGVVGGGERGMRARVTLQSPACLSPMKNEGNIGPLNRPSWSHGQTHTLAGTKEKEAKVRIE